MTALPGWPVALLCAAVGIVLGIVHFRALALAVTAWTGGNRRGLALVVTLARWGMTVAALALAAHLGTLPLLALAAGILAGRQWVLRRMEARR